MGVLNIISQKKEKSLESMIIWKRLTNLRKKTVLWQKPCDQVAPGEKFSSIHWIVPGSYAVSDAIQQ